MTSLIEEFEGQLASATDQKQKIDLMNTLAWELRQVDLARAMTISKQAGELATQGIFAKHPYQKGLAESQHYLGRLHSQAGDYESALSLLFQSLSLFEALDDQRGQALNLNGIGATCLFMGNYPEALQFFLEALNIFESIDDELWVAGLLNNIGYLYLELEDPEKALQFLDRSLQLAQNIGEEKLQGDVLDSSCKAYLRLGDSQKALDCGLRSVDLFRKVGARQGEAEALDNVGNVYYASGDEDQALAYFQQALEISLEMGIRFEAVEALQNLGRLHHRRGQTELALSYLDQALSIAQDIDAKQKLYECHLLLTEVYKQAGDFKSALAHHEQYHAIKTTIFNETTDRMLNNLEIAQQLDTIRKEAKIQQLRTVTLQQEVSERNQAEEALKKVNLQLQEEISAREQLIADLNAFAHMVAHDLKSPVTAITGYAFMLGNKLKETNDIEVLRYVEIIEQTGYRMNRIIDELLLLASVRQQQVVPRPLDMASIVQEVEERLSYMAEEFRAEITKPTSWPIATGYAPWVEEVWANYISNAIKYGGIPPRIELGVEPLDDGSIRFFVRDNGEGIPPEIQTNLFTPFTRLDQVRATGHGLGLSIVKRIVDKLGGQVGVESEGIPGLGCVFSFTLPSVIQPEEAT